MRHLASLRADEGSEAFIAQVQVEHDRYQAENERLRQLVTWSVRVSPHLTYRASLATRAGIDIGDALDPDFDPESIQLGSSSASSSMSYSTAPITPVEEMALDPIPPQPIPAPITLPSPPPPPPPIAQWLDGMYASPQPVYPPLYYAGSSGPTLPRLCDPSFATPFWSGLRLYEP